MKKFLLLFLITISFNSFAQTQITSIGQRESLFTPTNEIENSSLTFRDSLYFKCAVVESSFFKLIEFSGMRLLSVTQLKKERVTKVNTETINVYFIY